MPLQDWPTTGGNLLTRHARRLPWLTGMLFVLTSHLTAALLRWFLGYHDGGKRNRQSCGAEQM